MFFRHKLACISSLMGKPVQRRGDLHWSIWCEFSQSAGFTPSTAAGCLVCACSSDLNQRTFVIWSSQPQMRAAHHRSVRGLHVAMLSCKNLGHVTGGKKLKLKYLYVDKNLFVWIWTHKEHYWKLKNSIKTSNK